MIFDILTLDGAGLEWKGGLGFCTLMGSMRYIINLLLLQIKSVSLNFKEHASNTAVDSSYYDFVGSRRLPRRCRPLLLLLDRKILRVYRE